MITLEEKFKILEDRMNRLEKSDRYIFEKTVVFKGRVGFFNAPTVSQQLKADHNNWAASSDVVSALVNLGLFDQN